VRVLTIDYETDIVQPGLGAPPAVVGSISEDGRAELCADLTERIAQALAAGDVLVGANIAYDLGVVCAERPTLVRQVFDAYEAGRVYDVLVAEALHDIAEGRLAHRYALESVVEGRLRRDDAKRHDWARLRYALFRGVPLEHWTRHAELLGCPDPSSVAQYPLDDVTNTELVARAQRDARNRHEIAAQSYTAWCLHLAALWGWRTDPERVEALRQRIEETIAPERVHLRSVDLLTEDDRPNQQAVRVAVARAYGATQPCTVCGGSGRATSPKTGNEVQCKACSATGLHAPEAPTTPTGGIRADRDTLEQSGNADLEALAELGEAFKLRDTYLPVLESGSTAPLSFRPNVLLANGRTSNDGVIQLMPRAPGVREAFTVPEGYVLCSTDYPALEMTTLAQVLFALFGENSLQRRINDGVDLHDAFGGLLTNTTYEAFHGARPKDKRLNNIRQACKAGNFGFPGGMGPPRFVVAKRREGLHVCILMGQAPLCSCCGEDSSCRQCRGRGALCGVRTTRRYRNQELDAPICELCLSLTEQLRTTWFEFVPEMRIFFAWVTARVDAAGELEQLISKRIRGGLSFCDAANTMFSGLAADLAKRATRLVSRAMYCDETSPLWDSRLLGMIHDELLSALPADRAHVAGPEQARLMDVALAEYCPDVRPKRVDAALMTHWSKSAEPVYRDGVLTLWSPSAK